MHRRLLIATVVGSAVVGIAGFVSGLVDGPVIALQIIGLVSVGGVVSYAWWPESRQKRWLDVRRRMRASDAPPVPR